MTDWVRGKRVMCTRCGGTWALRFDRKPAACPKCHSPWWDKPRRNKKKKRK